MNFAAEFQPKGGRVVWWSLTQAEERNFGFDASVYTGGRGFLFQFKAVHKRAAALRYHAEHDQMLLLRAAAVLPNSVFYVLPTVRTWADFYASGTKLLTRAWLLDVHAIPSPISPPLLLRGIGLRKSRIHYIDLHPPRATIRSDPVTVGVSRATLLLTDDLPVGVEDIEHFAGPRQGVTCREVRDSS